MRAERFGNYVLVDLLGRGGMAEVFLARAQSLGGFEKLLAIKRLLPPYNTDQQIISMLGDEARLSLWLNHPNIVQVMDFGRVGRTYYIAMEYVDGCDLCDLIRPDGQTPGQPLPLPTALYVMVQIAEALAYAHGRKNRRGAPLGIIHRDVSPHNVLISREGQVKLADFGLARASVSVHHSAAGVVRGKFSYMPREQARGRPIDHRIDLFAAGVTLYEALTGVKPYTSTTLAQQLYQLEQPVPPPSALVSEIPEEIDDITLQAMSPDPETRYGSADDLTRDLRDALAQYSTFNQEADRLAALVRKLRGSGPAAPAALPFMSLGELQVPEGSLIGEAVRAAQQAAQANAPGQGAPRGPSGGARSKSATPVDDDEGDTYRLEHPEAAFEPQQTVLLPEPASPAAPPHSSPAAAPPGNDEIRRRAAGSLNAVHLDPRDTLEDGPPASGEELDDARTIQRSPEEAVAAFRRALDDREQRRQQSSPPRPQPRTARLGAGSILLLSIGGLLLFGIGLAVGWLMPRRQPAPHITLRKLCPEAEPCPPCPIPRAGSAAADRVVAPPAGSGVVPDASSLTQGSMAAGEVGPDAGATEKADPQKARGRAASKVPRRHSSGGKSRAGRPMGGNRVGDTGYLTVTTGGAPARVLVDDQSKAHPTPLTRLPLSAGVHRIRIYSEDNQTYSDPQWVTIKAGQTATLSFALE